MKDKVNIVVGICTKNVEDTIEGVIKVVDQGLNNYFPEKNSLIIVSDGFSKDHTKERANKTVTRTEKMVLDQVGKIGKGNGVKTIFIKAEEVEADAVALVDGDLTSITPQWLKYLVQPILTGHDLVAPFYARHKYDGVITNHLAYPLTRALYGISIRQPIGGEYGLSAKMVKKALVHPLFPDEFGIDIFITTVAACEDIKMIEAKLGIKTHDSTKDYKDPKVLLIPMFNQVTGSILDLTIFYKDFSKRKVADKSVEKIGIKEVEIPKEVVMDISGYINDFKKGYEEIIKAKNFFLSEKIISSLDKISKSSGVEDFIFPIDLWAQIVYYSLNYYEQKRDRKEDVLEILRILWQGRLASFAIETKDLNIEQSEEVIQQQVEVFKEYKEKIWQ
ncbi:MAG: glycosyltransferase [Atribacterota bacterium]